MRERESARSELRRYVAGKLVGAELDAFEAAMFKDAALLAAVEEEQVLYEGLRAQPSSVVVLAPAQQSHSRAPFRWLALAASFLVGAAGALAVRFQIASRGVETNVPVLLLEGSRSAVQPARTFRVSPGATHLILQFPVAKPSADATFDLRLRDAAGNERLHLDGLRPDGDDMLTLIVPATALPLGNYRAQAVLHGGRDETNVEFGIAN